MIRIAKNRWLTTSTLSVFTLACIFTVTPMGNTEARSRHVAPPSLSGINHRVNDFGRGRRNTEINVTANFTQAARVSIDGSIRSSITTTASYINDANDAESKKRERWTKEVSIRVNNSREPVMVSCGIATTARYDVNQQLKPCQGINVAGNTLVKNNQVFTQQIIVDSEDNPKEDDTVLINVSYL